MYGGRVGLTFSHFLHRTFILSINSKLDLEIESNNTYPCTVTEITLFSKLESIASNQSQRRRIGADDRIGNHEIFYLQRRCQAALHPDLRYQFREYLPS